MKDELKDLDPRVKAAQDKNQAIDEKNIYSALVVSPGWLRLEEFVRAQVATSIHEVIHTPLHSDPSVTVERQEYIKGMVAGMLLVIDGPASAIATADSIIDALQTEDDHDE